MWYQNQNIGNMLFGFGTKHACERQTNRRTDGQNYNPQDRASISALRGNYMSTKLYQQSIRFCIQFDYSTCYLRLQQKPSGALDHQLHALAFASLD